MTSDPVAQHRAQTLRPWRAAFVLFAAAMTVGTHWPALDLGTPDAPAPDKLIHLYAFAGLTFLLWRTRWLKRGWQVGLVAIGWVFLDEWTQSLPLLERTFSWMDVTASLLGVAVILVWGWALKARGGAPNRARLGLVALVTDRMFRGWRGWALIVAALAPVGLALLFVWPRVMASFPDILPGMIYGVSHALWLGLLLMLWFQWWEAESASVIEERACFRCGSSCARAAVGGDGGGACPTCGEGFHLGQWQPPRAPPPRTMLRMAGPSIALAILLFILGTAATAMLVRFYVHLLEAGWIGRIAGDAVRGVHRLPRDLVMAIDLSVLLAALAAATHLYRRRLARNHDRQAVLCRTCAHDLRGTPTDRGVGVCGECGGPFARFGDALPDTEPTAPS